MEKILWYDRPAAAWEEALPLGNGSLGLMVYGGVETERLQISEEGMWSGYPQDANNPECREHLDEMRALVFAGKYAEADALCRKYLVCRNFDPQAYGSYETAGEVFIQTCAPLVDSSGYRRELDILDGISTVSFGKQVRRALVSRQYGVAAVCLEDPDARQIRIHFDGRPDATVTVGAQGEILVRGKFPGERGVSYCTLITADAPDGRVWGGRDSERSGIFVAASCRTTLWITTATTYHTDDDPEAVCRARIAEARKAGFDALLADNCEIWHRNVMNRAVIMLEGEEDRSALPTDRRLEAVARGENDPALAALYFQYARYLLYASSGKLPANLQGIWVKDSCPPWQADFHTNINLQMLYWIADSTALFSCIEPFFELIEHLIPAGEETARVQYGCRGWVLHTILNAHDFTAPGTDPMWGSFVCGGAWCCRHFFEHYLYTGRRDVLRRAYPILRGSAEFFLDFLVRDPRSGYLVTAPASSPENRFFDPVTHRPVSMCAGPTMDTTIVRELFDEVIAATEILGEDAEFADRVRAARAELAPLRVGKYGQIMEWPEDFEEPEPGHRHMSHLYGLYPGSEITTDEALCQAARVSLERRLANGGGHTGWSNAWLVCFFARLHDGDRAGEMLNHLLAKGTFRNLFDFHPTAFFQMDGNIGGAAGMVEMLLQSHTDEIVVLPALPRAWKNGSFSGLRARGAFEVSGTFRDGRLTELYVLSLGKNPLHIRWNGGRFDLPTTEGGRTYRIL